jgi:hypothetical protein
MSLTLDEAWQNYYEAVLRGRRSENSEIGRWKNHIAPVVGKMHIEGMTNFNYLKLKKK